MLTKSESIAELVKALVKAQASFEAVEKKHQNPFYKSNYADLGDIIAATFPALRENGLAVIQLPGMNGTGMPNVTTMLTHTSGEWIAGELSLPAGKPDAQGYGSAFTYGRRYGLQAILGVAAEEDDDGNAASDTDKKSKRPSPAPTAKPTATAPQPAPPTSAQVGDASLLTLNISEVTKEQTKGGKPYLWVRDGRKSVACFKAELYDAINGQMGEDVTFRVEQGKKGQHIVGIVSEPLPPPARTLEVNDGDIPF